MESPLILIGLIMWRGKNSTALTNGNVYEIDSSIILQPGPAFIFEGIDEIQKCISKAVWSRMEI